MKITLAKSAGFCFGVKRAINIAHRTANKNSNVYILGDIVHNEDVVREIKSCGIKKTGRLSRGDGKTLIIRAHGAPLNTFNRAKQLGYNVVDATCTMVKEIHKIARDMESKGYIIIVIGDKDHAEVKGIVGHLKSKAIIIDSVKNIPAVKFSKNKKYCVVVQSTQEIRKVDKIVSILHKHIDNLVFRKTICRPTILKQEEITKMPLNNDVMIIIGSGTSANTMRLYEISKSFNKNTYWIQSAKDIKPAWFKGVKKVGITSGASTPDSTTEKVIQRLEELS